MKHYCVTYYDGKGERLMYVQPWWMNKAQKRYAEEVMRCRKDFQYWFDKYVVVKPKK